jgi:hypothetical protein
MASLSLYLSTSKMLMGIDIEQISVIIFVRVLNMIHYVVQGDYIALQLILKLTSNLNKPEIATNAVIQPGLIIRILAVIYYSNF